MVIATPKLLFVVTALLCSCLASLVAQQDPKEISSAALDARDRDALLAKSNSRVVVDGVVVSVRQETDDSAGFLEFSEDLKGFSARLLPPAYMAKQPLDSFVGKRLKVSGLVLVLDGKPEIRVTDVGQIEFARASESNAGSGRYPLAAPVPGKPGFVTSPHNPEGGFIDVRGFPSGTEVKDPYSGKIFLVP